MTQKKGIRQRIKATYKSEDTEEPVDIYFYRPVGYGWAVLAAKAGITPNMITIASIFIGMAAGVLFYFPDIQLNLIGMALLVLANSFDSADGQLARMTNNKTQLGRILDGLAGDLWFIVIYVALTLRCLHGGWEGYIWAIGVAAGVSHIIHAAMADYYRNIHLYFIKGTVGSEMHHSRALTEEYGRLCWKQNFMPKLILFFYRNYTRQQEMLTPRFQQFIARLYAAYPAQDYPPALRTAFRAHSKPLMKYTNILQFNTRVIVLFICLFMKKPEYYFFFDLIVLNGVLVYMICRHETLCKRMLLKLNAQKALINT
jgi:phosphatidylglycerophosphate synthase